jgi:hypothetical protein
MKRSVPAQGVGRNVRPNVASNLRVRSRGWRNLWSQPNSLTNQTKLMGSIIELIAIAGVYRVNVTSRRRQHP